MRILPWLVLLVLVIYVVRKKIRKAMQAQVPPVQPAELDGEAMVQCQECGMHIPVSEALPGPGGRVFCSDEHRTRNTAS